jgi:argonaute-like protein implicated in RNA metabolism and viral defense
MTKKQEIARLDSLIQSLGSDSYLGPWLKSVKGEVEQMITSDFFPDVKLSDTIQAVAKLRKDAKEDCDRMVARAQAEATGIKKEADEYRANSRFQIRRELEDLISKYPKY